MPAKSHIKEVRITVVEPRCFAAHTERAPFSSSVMGFGFKANTPLAPPPTNGRNAAAAEIDNSQGLIAWKVLMQIRRDSVDLQDAVFATHSHFSRLFQPHPSDEYLVPTAHGP